MMKFSDYQKIFVLVFCFSIVKIVSKIISLFLILNLFPVLSFLQKSWKNFLHGKISDNGIVWNAAALLWSSVTWSAMLWFIQCYLEINNYLKNERNTRHCRNNAENHPSFARIVSVSNMGKRNVIKLIIINFVERKVCNKNFITSIRTCCY